MLYIASLPSSSFNLSTPLPPTSSSTQKIFKAARLQDARYALYYTYSSRIEISKPSIWQSSPPSLPSSFGTSDRYSRAKQKQQQTSSPSLPREWMVHAVFFFQSSSSKSSQVHPSFTPDERILQTEDSRLSFERKKTSEFWKKKGLVR